MMRLNVGDTWRWLNSLLVIAPATVIRTDENGMSYVHNCVDRPEVSMLWSKWGAYYEQGKVEIVSRARVIMLFCPWCGTRHEDLDEWASKPHHTHLCSACDKTWRLDEYVYGKQCKVDSE